MRACVKYIHRESNHIPPSSECIHDIYISEAVANNSSGVGVRGMGGFIHESIAPSLSKADQRE